MTVTLADVDRWDPEAIRTVFDAAIRRAHGTRTASAAVAEMMRLLNFGGVAAEAAQAATQHTNVVLDDHAGACEAVARAAEQSADEVTGIKSRLRAMRDFAAENQLAIDDQTGAVLPPSNVYSRSAAELQRIFDAALRLAEDVRTLLAAAELADEDLAAAIRGTDGDLSPTQIDAQLSHQLPAVPAVPPDHSTADQVSRWWHALLPGQQDQVRECLPSAIRNLDGIPVAVRSRLNRTELQHEITRLGQGWYDGAGYWRTDPEKLADLQALRHTLETVPESGLILLDTTGIPGKVLAAVGVGDVDNAECVGVMVPGLNSRVSATAADLTNQAALQRDKARDLRASAHRRNPGAVASIAWLGYDAPDSLRDVTHDWHARDGARRLNSFYQGLAAASNVADQHITAFGHSYGSLVTSLALQQGAPVSDVVLYGSPGGELSNASQLGVQPGHAYYMIGREDVVAETIPGFGAFGAGLQDVPGMVPLSTATGVAPPNAYGDGQLHERAYGHSDYGRLGSNGQLRMSAYNMAAVLAGLPDDLIRPPALGPR